MGLGETVRQSLFLTVVSVGLSAIGGLIFLPFGLDEAAKVALGLFLGLLICSWVLAPFFDWLNGEL